MKKIIVALTLAVYSTAWAAAKPEPSVLLYNLNTNITVVDHYSHTVRPMASITKLMTAIVALDTGYALERRTNHRRRFGGVLPPKTYTRRELLTAMLVRSDNSAAETLANDYPGGRAEFIQEMNDRARSLGMKNTHFDDASGLSATNITTARDLAILLKEALNYDFVREISTTKATEITVPTKKHPNARVVITNTNSPLLSEFTTVVSKTGLTSQAGWCVAMVIDEGGQRYIIVVLGAPNKNTRMKIVEKTVFANLRSN